MRAGKFTDDRVLARFVPGHRQAVGGKLLFIRQVKKRRQQKPLLYCAHSSDLRDAQHGLLAATRLRGVEAEVGYGRIGGSEINADGIASHSFVGAWSVRAWERAMC